MSAGFAAPPERDGFAPRYVDARAGFRAGAEAAGLDVLSLGHPLRGADDEALALDVVCAGPDGASAVLLISSGCHGIEGICGDVPEPAELMS